jgi:thymidylate synthase (FAD)
MRIIKPSFEIWDQEEGLEGVYKQIERAGRVCYKSEDKITEDSAKEFVERMIKSSHGAMLEHGTVYLKIPFGKMLDNGEFENEALACWFVDNPYSWVKIGGVGTEDCWYVTSNYRVLIEKNLLYTLQYLCEPTEFHEKRVTVHFVCDRGVSHEYVRHRVFSFAQESTRYCNYSKDKFGKECTFIIPSWLGLSKGSYTYDYPSGFTKDGNKWNSEIEFNPFLLSLARSEATYLELIEQGWIAQQARAVLPNALKTELVMTGFVSDWEHFFKLRDAGSAHPQARELAHPLHEEFKNRNLLK